VRRALENTAKPVGGDAPDAALTYGCGLLQVVPSAECTTCSARSCFVDSSLLIVP